MYIQIKLTHYDDTEKWVHDSQVVRAKENLKFSYAGPTNDKHHLSFPSGTSLGLRPDPPSCNKIEEESIAIAINLEWVHNQAWGLSHDIHVVSNS